MIRLRVAGPNFEDLARSLDAMAHPDLMPLAERLRPVMIEDNRSGLMAGLDWNGDPMAPVEESTIRRGRGGDGPPLVPRGEASRVIADYQVAIQEEPDRLLLVGHWPGTPWVHFPATGFQVHTRAGPKGVPARDPTGIRQPGQDAIAAELYDFASSLIGGAP